MNVKRCAGKSQGTSLGSDFRGKGDGIVFKVCAKILVRLLLEHEPFFFIHFQFASVLTVNFSDIASSLVLPIVHLLLVFHFF